MICITASGKDLDSAFDPRFGRCAYFIFVDPKTMEFEAIANEGAELESGAGLRAAQKVVEKGAKVLITGQVCMNAF